MTSTATVVGGSFVLFLLLCWAYAWFTTPPRITARRARGRARRRGGYIRPPASRITNQVTTHTIAGTRLTEDFYSSHGGPGDRRAGSEILRTRLEGSSFTEPGSSTAETDEAGANGQPRPSAALLEWKDGSETVDNTVSPPRGSVAWSRKMAGLGNDAA